MLMVGKRIRMRFGKMKGQCGEIITHNIESNLCQIKFDTTDEIKDVYLFWFEIIPDNIPRKCHCSISNLMLQGLVTVEPKPREIYGNL
jgi:hypothetical protein